MSRSRLLLSIVIAGLLPAGSALAQWTTDKINCENPYSPIPCLDRRFHQSFDPEYAGKYIGHDEPGVNFYSDVPGSGNYSRYRVILPRDPQKFPTAANLQGTGGPTVWNFQLYWAFWFGMALCDSEAYPAYTHECPADSDENIFADADPKSPKYIGHHPGTGVAEVFFEPPGYGNIAGFVNATKWTVLLGIGSFYARDPGPTGSLFAGGSGGVLNNAACQNTAGAGLNLALLTLDGIAQAPGDSLNTDPNKLAVIDGRTLQMNSGDDVLVTLHDTAEGFQVVVEDLTTHQTGSMTASVANGFTQLVFDPTATTCASRPYAFHPMYSTSSPETFIPWAAKTSNVAMTVEIGHFSYCSAQDNSVAPGIGICLASPVAHEFDPVTGLHETDDQYCVDAASSLTNGSLGPLGGCTDSDVDWDGLSYRHAWPGSGRDAYGFSALPEPIRFTSPKFMPSGSGSGPLKSYARAAFETNVASNEDLSYCPYSGGPGCVMPPPGALFYPLFTTTMKEDRCWWQLGGASIAGTTNTFGGTAATEFNTQEFLLDIAGTTANPGSTTQIGDFYRLLPSDPCASD